MKSAAQVYKQAEELKIKVSAGDILNDNEAWTCHQQLQKIYQKLLLIDLEYALDKKVEQDLWNYVFKNQINVLQAKTKDKKNPRRAESQSNLTWFLESSSGFYLQLLQEFCEAFALDLPCRRKGSVYGILKGSKSPVYKITPPQKSSSLYICQYCLVHLGDIARYRNQLLQAETFYRHAAQLVPSSGHPYNQLALLEATKGEKLTTVFYYMRSITVKHMFPVAATNLQKMFAKISTEDATFEGKAKLSVYDYISAFLQFHSKIHFNIDFMKAERLLRVLSSNLTTLVATEALSTWKLIQITAINLFAVNYATHLTDLGVKSSTPTPTNMSSSPEPAPTTLEVNGIINGLKNINNSQSPEPLGMLGMIRGSQEDISDDEKKVKALILDLIASQLNGILLLVHTMKPDVNLQTYFALPVVKLIIDWIKFNPTVLQENAFTTKLQIWPSLCKLLNGLQTEYLENFDNTEYDEVPLPEDWDLQSFLPLAKSQREYRFHDENSQLSEDEENKLRAWRLVKHGRWLCEQEVNGKPLLRVDTNKSPDLLTFEAINEQAPSSDLIRQLTEISIHKCDDLNSHDIVLNVDPAEGKRIVYSPQDIGKRAGYHGDKMDKTDSQKPVVREKKGRQNVAMQAILQKKNTGSKNVVIEPPVQMVKSKSDWKQVTFKTPSPSPPTESEDTGLPFASYGSTSLTPGSVPYDQQTLYNAGNSIEQTGQYMQANTLMQQMADSKGISMPHQNYPGNHSSFPNLGIPVTNNFHQGFIPSQSSFIDGPASGRTTSQPLPVVTGMQNGSQLMGFSPPQQNLMMGIKPMKNPQQFMSPRTSTSQFGPGFSMGPVNQFQYLVPNQMVNSQQVGKSQASIEQMMVQIAASSGRNGSLGQPSLQQQQSPQVWSNFPPQDGNFVRRVPYPYMPSFETGGSLPPGPVGSPSPHSHRDKDPDMLSPPTNNQASKNQNVDNEPVYSLFSSPWPSGLNLAASTKEGPGMIGTSAATPINTQPSGLFQPGLQSLWSSPGLSPLERLLEQQKIKRDTAPQ